MGVCPDEMPPGTAGTNAAPESSSDRSSSEVKAFEPAELAELEASRVAEAAVVRANPTPSPANAMTLMTLATTRDLAAA
jgi:hypothetical protein